MVRDTLQELERTYKAPEMVTKEKVKADKFNAAHYSTGWCNSRQRVC